MSLLNLVVPSLTRVRTDVAGGRDRNRTVPSVSHFLSTVPDGFPISLVSVDEML